MASVTDVSAPQLLAILNAATELAGLSGRQQPLSSSSLESVLRMRLDQSCSLVNDPYCVPEVRSLDELKLATAMRSAILLARIQLFIKNEDQSSDAVPLLGTRDTVVVQTLAALICKWGTNALLASLYTKWTSVMPPSQVVDLTDSAMHVHRLVSLTNDVLNLSCSFDDEIKVKVTRINAEFLSKHLADVMRAGCTLGWAECIDETLRGVMRNKVTHILGIVSPSRAIAALGSLIAGSAPAKPDDPPPLPPHARKAILALLSQQLLRDNGIRGLCAALLGDDVEQDDAPYDRLDQITKLLCTVPAGMKISVYFEHLIPRLFRLLQKEILQEAQIPPAHKRAAAFTLSYLLSPNFRHVRVSRAIILRSLHLPLVPPSSAATRRLLSPYGALQVVVALVLRMDPSPPLVSAVLTPIVPSLMTLVDHLKRTRTAEPELRESIRGLVLAWGRVVPADESIERMWTVINGAGGAWEGSAESLHPIEPKDDLDCLPSASELFSDSFQDDTLNASLLMLRPDPTHFVDILREMGREDVAGALFVRTLEAYQHLQYTSGEAKLLKDDNDPRRPLLYLQIILQIQSSIPKALETLANSPERLLRFIRTTVERHLNASAQHRRQLTTHPLSLDELLIVENVRSHDDSDDEDEDAEEIPGTHVRGLIEIALHVLLSLLELHESLLPRDTPGLQELAPLLHELEEDKTDAGVRRTAREAIFVLRARSAASSLVQPSVTPQVGSQDDAQVTYQRALKLIDDPLLPVRASGLTLLRSPAILQSPALVPAALDVFLRAVRDGESFVYLNAVQGLVTLTLSSGGYPVLRTLVRMYGEGARGLDTEEIDKRLRIGQALNQVVKHLDVALAVHVNTIVPQLFALVRERDAPTVLRASAIGVLGQCVESAPGAMLGYAVDLSGAILDLLQTETEVVATESQAPKDNDVDDPDDSPATLMSKHPPLRRAAVHFLALLFRSWITRAYSGTDATFNVTQEFMQHARVVMDYVSSTDKDDIVRIMCREARELIEQLFMAHLGM